MLQPVTHGDAIALAQHQIVDGLLDLQNIDVDPQIGIAAPDPFDRTHVAPFTQGRNGAPALNDSSQFPPIATTSTVTAMHRFVVASHTRPRSRLHVPALVHGAPMPGGDWHVCEIASHRRVGWQLH